MIGNNLSLTFGNVFRFNLRFNLYRINRRCNLHNACLFTKNLRKNASSHRQGIPKLSSRVPIGQRSCDVVEVWLGSALLTGWHLNAIGLGPGGQHVLY